MNRRPKLKLAAANENGQKSQPSGFDTTTSARPQECARETSTGHGRVNGRGVASANDEVVVPRRAWPTARQVAKVLLIVTVSALGIYLLKRRFF